MRISGESTNSISFLVPVLISTAATMPGEQLNGFTVHFHHVHFATDAGGIDEARRLAVAAGLFDRVAGDGGKMAHHGATAGEG